MEWGRSQKKQQERHWGKVRKTLGPHQESESPGNGGGMGGGAPGGNSKIKRKSGNTGVKEPGIFK